MNRIFDLLLATIILFPLIPVLIILYVFITITSGKPTIHWSRRVGKNNKVFSMPKFRTMKLDTPQIATHLFDNPDRYLIFGGLTIRKMSLDELPQIYSIFKGDMKFVGPRPALFNQKDLITLRKSKGIDKLLPGISGWAQVNGRDDLSIEDKVAHEEEYLRKRSFIFDLYIIWLTLIKVMKKDNISR